MAILLRSILSPLLVCALWIVFNLFFVSTNRTNSTAPNVGTATSASDAQFSPGRNAYRFWAEKAGGLVRIGGDLPDVAARDAVLALLRSHARPLSLVDETSLRSDAPPRFDVVSRALLAALARLADGRATISGDVLTLRGRSFHQNAALSIVRDLQDVAMPDYRADATLMVEDVAGPMNVALCREESLRLMAGDSVEFEEGGERIAPSAMGLLDPLVELLRRCSQSGVGVRIGAAGGQGGADADLSARRALSLAAYLHAEGLAREAIRLDSVASLDGIGAAGDIRDLIEVQLK